ncbi:hypothetical protein BJ741DRAFT_707582 [Chytriomyces cf. hyalinus JEL632]|nr:hypothetical protein BJ741DRAFT_707582 [Chytriomyces cf. hyalinus JEL632]
MQDAPNSPHPVKDVVADMFSLPPSTFNHANHHPQIAPIVPHTEVKTGTPLSKEEELLYALYPILNPAVQAKYSSKETASQLTNPIIVDDEFILADIAINIRKLVKAYPVQWGTAENKKRLVDEVIQKKKEAEYGEKEFVRVTRLAAALLPLNAERQNKCREKYERIITRDGGVSQGIGSYHNGSSEPCPEHSSYQWPEEQFAHSRTQNEADITTDSTLQDSPACTPITTTVHAIPTISMMMNEYTHFVAQSAAAKTTYVVEWYVAFTDQEIFQFHESPSRFASEEINTLQHPVLGNLKLCLKDLGDNGVFAKPANGCPSPVIPFDIHFHLQKEKANNTLRNQELFLYSRDYANLCTPVLFMGVPMLACVNLQRDYGKPYLGEKKMFDKLKGYTHSLPRTTDSGAQRRPYNNIISMSAPDRLANPLRPRVGPYTRYQIRHIFRTAYTAYRGAVLKSKETWLCLKESSKKETSLLGAGDITATKTLEVAIHTGDWGAGEFQNNKTVIAFCQIAAAYAAGVDHLFYHVPANLPTAHIIEARGLVDKAWPPIDGKPVLLENLFAFLEGQGYEWVK